MTQSQRITAAAPVGRCVGRCPAAGDRSLATGFPPKATSLPLVGGSVRDAMLGRLGNDLDFTTSARPEAVLKILNRWAESTWDVGIRFRHGWCGEGRIPD